MSKKVQSLAEQRALAVLDRVEREHPQALASVGAVVETLAQEELVAKRKAKGKDTVGARVTIAVRVPADWIEELDVIAAEASAGPEAKVRGESYTRSDAARWLIGESLKRRREGGG